MVKGQFRGLIYLTLPLIDSGCVRIRRVPSGERHQSQYPKSTRAQSTRPKWITHEVRKASGPSHQYTGAFSHASGTDNAHSVGDAALLCTPVSGPLGMTGWGGPHRPILINIWLFSPLT
jgi:hypothetical protein